MGVRVFDKFVFSPLLKLTRFQEFDFLQPFGAKGVNQVYVRCALAVMQFEFQPFGARVAQVYTCFGCVFTKTVQKF